MKWIQNKFRKISRKYQNKKTFFRKKIEKWKTKGWLDSYEKGKKLLDEADRLSDELKKNLFLEVQTDPDTAQIKYNLKRFKKVYKQLNESTKSAIQQWTEAIVIALVLAFVLRHTIFSPYHVPTGSAEPNILVGDRIWGNKMAYYFNDIKHGDLVIFDDPRHIYDHSNIVQYLWQRYIGFPIPVLGLKAGPINVVKRVIALPGDTIQGKIEDGKTVIYRNGKKLNEPYLNPYPLVAVKRKIGFLPFDSLGPIQIPYFLKRRKPDHGDRMGFLWYTYVPSKSYDQQPYYYMSEESVVKNPDTNELLMRKSLSPTYDINMRSKQFYSIDTFGPITLPKDMYWAMGDSRKNSGDSRSWGTLHRKFIRGRASFILFSIDSEEPFWLFDLLSHPIAFWTKHVRWSRTFKGLGETVKGVEKIE